MNPPTAAPDSLLHRCRAALAGCDPVASALIVLGTLLRIWHIGVLPPGLNQDEASTGVDAFSLYRYGVDRHLLSYPVHFIAWGSGQNALYAYLTIPFIAMAGLTPLAVRLPMMLSGVLTLPLVYFVARRTWGVNVARLALFLTAICPWHIMLSHWGLESNILPFVFLLGYACLLKADEHGAWAVTAFALLGLCLYAYGPAYAAVPVFLACAIPWLLRAGRLRAATLLVAVPVLALVIAPIVLFVMVNLFGWDTLHWGAVTIPRLPTSPRFATHSVMQDSDVIVPIIRNVKYAFMLLMKQTDGLPWNGVDPFGYMYAWTFPLAIIGAIPLLYLRSPRYRPEHGLMLAWLLAAVTCGALQVVNINRINLLFLPVLMCMACGLDWIGRMSRWTLRIAVGALCVGCVAFCWTYFGGRYAQVVSEPFAAGLLPALEQARRSGNGPICVTDDVNMPYIFALFVERQDPHQYVPTMRLDPNSDPQFQQVRAVARYTFGVADCLTDRATIYVLRKESLPAAAAGLRYREQRHEAFHVYVPE